MMPGAKKRGGRDERRAGVACFGERGACIIDIRAYVIH